MSRTDAPAARPGLGRLVRFALVGTVNTAVDFGIYTALVLLHAPVVPANLVSTSCGLVVSFVLNGRYVFRTDQDGAGGRRARRLVLFVATTGVGLWVLQPLVILGVTALIAPLSLPAALAVLVPKTAATVVSLVWNYCCYNFVVFAGPSRPGSLDPDRRAV